MKAEPEYRLLASVLNDALNQAQNGKGKERHACGEPFEQQEICLNTRAVGFGYPLGQARKKAREAKRLLETRGKDAAMAECLGAINYLAAAVIVMDESEGLKLGDHSERTAAEDVERTLRHRQMGNLREGVARDAEMYQRDGQELKHKMQILGFLRKNADKIYDVITLSRELPWIDAPTLTMALDDLALAGKIQHRDDHNCGDVYQAGPIPDHVYTQEEDDAFEMMAVRQEWESKPSDVPG